MGAIYDDMQFAGLFPLRGQPAEAPARLALATILQFVEGLSDRRAADAVRGRIDWKYALGLELTDPGFDHTVLSEFRTRLVRGQAEQVLLDTLLERLRGRGFLNSRGRQRTDSTHILAAIRVLNSPAQNIQVLPVRLLRRGMVLSSQHPLPWCGVNSTLFVKHQLDQPPEPHST